MVRDRLEITAQVRTDYLPVPSLEKLVHFFDCSRARFSEADRHTLTLSVRQCPVITPLRGLEGVFSIPKVAGFELFNFRLYWMVLTDR